MINKRAGIVVTSACALLVGTALYTGVAAAQEAVKMYTVSNVNSEADAAACGKAGHTGLVMYKLDANGGVVEQLGFGCLKEVK